MLTPAQTAQFRRFGFLILRRIFSAAEMEENTRQANQVWQEDRKTEGLPYQIDGYAYLGEGG